MRALSHFEVVQISGAQSKDEAYRSTVEHVTFITTLIGGAASAIYSIATNHTVATTVGLTTTYASSFPTVLCMGIGMSFALGVGIGTLVALNNYSQST